MRLKRINIEVMRFLVIALLFYLIASGSQGLFATIYPLTALALTVHIWSSQNGWKVKTVMTLVYIFVMIVQLSFNVLVVFSGEETGLLFELKRIVAVCMILAPFFALYVNYLYSVQRRFFPAVRDASAVSFQRMTKVYDTLTSGSLAEVARDIPRHSYTRYLNKNTLTEDYFKDCEASLEDEHLYIVVSSTGSSSSELISLFTRREYNHASLSFDRDLKTILSYNGGENVYPPGLNREDLDYFHRKSDASMLVYCLDAPREKKRMVLEKIKEINRNGSAYNLVGLVTKVSVRPNIMFCSQFVYSILRYAGLVYFTEKAACVKPSDLIEKDYYRKLKFCYEIRFRDVKTA